MFDEKKVGLVPWYSLATPEPSKTAQFYCELLDIQKTEFEIAGMGKTTMLQKGDKSFADVGEHEAPTPCHWVSYLTVENVDQFLPRAKRLGAQSVGEAFDIPTIGRGAVVTDPCGARFIAFTPLDWKRTTSAMGSEKGLICWNELIVNDTAKAIAFYGECFGWRFKEGPPQGDIEYHHFTTAAGQQSGGIMKRLERMGEFPAVWLPYFMTSDLEKTTAQVAGLGGEVLMPPTVIPQTGRFSFIKDPQGGMFYLFVGG